MKNYKKYLSGIGGAVLALVLHAGGAQAATLDDGLQALEKKDYKHALTVFDELFKVGKADAGFYMARMIELGVGVRANPKAARILYGEAAEKGSAHAINRLGLMYYRGEIGVLQNFKLAKENICKAADLGNKNAMFNCAEMYASGKGVEADKKQALSYYEKAAKAKHIGAFNTLGLMYKRGNGVDKDLNKSLSYFEQTAELGNAYGLFELGSFYETGLSVPKDLVKAHQYYNLASSRGHPKASQALQRITSAMTAKQVNEAQAQAQSWKAKSF